MDRKERVDYSLKARNCEIGGTLSMVICALSMVCVMAQEVAQEVAQIQEREYELVRSGADAVSIWWQDEEQKPLKTIQRAKAYAEQQGVELMYLVNGGIFEPTLQPTGLLVINGEEKSALNLRAGRGNFYLKPNGVFLITDGGDAKVVDALEYKGGSRYAVQSGPLLLSGGQRHPAFNKQSESRKVRNGVGVTREGEVVLLLSREPVNFYEFAEAFRALGCEDALYLDGVISRSSSTGGGGPFTSLIGVAQQEEAAVEKE